LVYYSTLKKRTRSSTEIQVNFNGITSLNIIVFILSRDRVTIDGFWIDNWIANSRTLFLSMAHVKSSMSPLDVAWQRIPTMSSGSVLMPLPAGYSPRVLEA
jgi:hypothetical protein